jgi:hypothetical protein
LRISRYSAAPVISVVSWVNTFSLGQTRTCTYPCRCTSSLSCFPPSQHRSLNSPLIRGVRRFDLDDWECTVDPGVGSPQWVYFSMGYVRHDSVLACSKFDYFTVGSGGYLSKGLLCCGVLYFAIAVVGVKS